MRPLWPSLCPLCGLVGAPVGSPWKEKYVIHRNGTNEWLLAWNWRSVLHEFFIISGLHFDVFGMDFFYSRGPCGTPCALCVGWSVPRPGKEKYVLCKNGTNKWLHGSSKCVPMGGNSKKNETTRDWKPGLFRERPYQPESKWGAFL